MIVQNTLMCTIVMLGKDAAGEMSLAYVPTQENIADLLTKALPREKFEAFRKALGLLPFVD